MRIAYADPPYPGRARKHYGDHPDFGGEVDHAELIDRLEREFDAWALSTSAKALPSILRLCPPEEPNPKQPGDTKEGTGVRVLAWTKTVAQPAVDAITYAWEPVIVRNARRQARRGPRPRDWLFAQPDVYPHNVPTPADHVTGAKPAAFCRWLFECMNAQPDDEFVDVFPGSGGVARAWDAWSAAPTIFDMEIPPVTMGETLIEIPDGPVEISIRKMVDET